MTVRWNNARGADGYVIFRKAAGETRLIYMYTVGKERLHWTDLNLVKGKVNFYFVVPYVNVGGEMVISPVKPYTYTVVPD
ncbi:MAG TPA: hypothetical protein GX717_01675 [Clostridiaceae bacterium]|nr:hypothetical protein [Clostridiaceae bacterium]